MDRMLGLKKIIREFKRCMGKNSKFFQCKILTYCLTREVEEIWAGIWEVGLKLFNEGLEYVQVLGRQHRSI